MSYLDVFDSVRSQTPSQMVASKLRFESLEAEALAEAGLIYRLLYGDSIILSNNQMIDSLPVLKLMPTINYLTNSTAMAPPVKVSFFRCGEHPNPDALWLLAKQTFENQKFTLSAWPDEIVDQRTTVAKNVTNELSKPGPAQRSFLNILQGIPKNDLAFQLAEGLQALYAYLTKWKDSGVCESAEPATLSIWESLRSLEDNPDAEPIPQEVLRGIEQYAEEEATQSNRTLEAGKKPKTKEDVLEERSFLYYAISQLYGDDLDRLFHVKSLIDWFYNQKLSESVNHKRSLGLFTLLDIHPPTDLPLQIKRMISADEDTADEAILDNIGFTIEARENLKKTSLTRDFFVDLWNSDTQFQKRQLEIHNCMQRFRLLEDGIDLPERRKIPRGFGISGLTAHDTAIKEISEEIDGSIESLISLGCYHANTGLDASETELFFAKITSVGLPNQEEAIEGFEWVPLAEFEKMVQESLITDGFTIAAYTRAKLNGLL